MKKIKILIALILLSNNAIFSQTDSLFNWFNVSCFEIKKAWLSENKAKIQNSIELINVLDSSTIICMKENKYVSAAYIDDIILINYDYEFEYNKKYFTFQYRNYPITMRLIDALLQTTQNKDFIDLLLNRKYLYHYNDNMREKQAILLQILDIGEQNLWQNNLKLCQKMIQFAWVETTLKHLDIAEKYYTNAYTNTVSLINISNQEYRDAYFSCFIKAGKGIIDCRRGNKQKLKELNPFLFINSTLSAYYEKAMLEVGEKVNWD